MRRRPPRSTRTGTLCPDTTLFRSAPGWTGGRDELRRRRLRPSVPRHPDRPCADRRRDGDRDRAGRAERLGVAMTYMEMLSALGDKYEIFDAFRCEECGGRAPLSQDYDPRPADDEIGRAHV